MPFENSVLASASGSSLSSTAKKASFFLPYSVRTEPDSKHLKMFTGLRRETPNSAFVLSAIRRISWSERAGTRLSTDIARYSDYFFAIPPMLSAEKLQLLLWRSVTNTPSLTRTYRT
jgi:hypothetical protein